MSVSQSFATKYRPKRFSEVVGQDMIVTIMKALATKRREMRVMLLSGQHGIGKTTLARLYAKLANCENPGADVCGECLSCNAMDKGRHPDYVEQDMGSRGLVGDVRSLREDALNKPTWRFKVFTLDEIHGASAQAFNAMLTLLEEPPRSAAFVMCTTELHQVPSTIASRALVLRLEPLRDVNIKQMLEKVVRNEKIGADSGVLDVIARNCNGAVRDSLMILERLCAAGDGKITIDLLRGETWYKAIEGVNDLMKALATGDDNLFEKSVTRMVSRLDCNLMLREAVRKLSMAHVRKGKRPGKLLNGLWQAYMRSIGGAEPELVMTSLWAHVRGGG